MGNDAKMEGKKHFWHLPVTANHRGGKKMPRKSREL